ncbi:RNA polymerase sigma-70 factor [Spirosoma utsteinense]|uniref:RNA polymerase sigma-70 factor (ECF subfamily) n=1 Tax=Spirosoma utsteinense TaxID=2585773 RepID=A0ABR6WAE6_9BACT|nr:RNA polymerase sigma-70 factor [Spirosoma utsteinense]MBC3783877.1 RNA polymerase sigma-70 factor (ECF subfamily) [Spirosoma utsteinense]MBC3793544.1 RNA polymerase sigma-70 factor (ECF subfamily) [Spirosoma utsteinense]
MAENLVDKHVSIRPFCEPDTNPVVLDEEFLIRQTFAVDARRGYELLFRRYYRALCSHAVRFVHSRTIAEDLVSEVFFSFWKNQVQQHITSSYQAYLYASVRKRAYTHLRAEFQLESLTHDPDVLSTAGSIDPEQLLEYTELYQRIEETVRTLPPQCQRVFIMSRFEGKKHREIADELKLSTKTIEAHLNRALSQLRRTLQMGLFCWLTLFSPPLPIPSSGFVASTKIGIYS